jgi:hypothetical protein
MKNIHLLPTDKPSKLYFFKDILEYDSSCIYTAIGDIIKQHIYITSDETLKENDWCFGMDGIFQYKGMVNIPDIELPKKIILTTDQDLMKNGVQAIDDTFLEWFVKNSSCEYVNFISYGNEKGTKDYELIILQEELKNSCPKCRTTDFDNCHSIQCPMREVKEKACTQDIVNEAMKIVSKDVRQPKCVRDGLVKQETLKEAAEIFVNNRFAKQITGNQIYPDIYASKEGIIESHILFANWQSERMYSKEDMIEFGNLILDHHRTKMLPKKSLLELFEQFKKNYIAKDENTKN